jgi:hypothetical protein
VIRGCSWALNCANFGSDAAAILFSESASVGVRPKVSKPRAISEP